MRKVTVSSEEVGSIIREYLRKKGLNLTNAILTISVDPDGRGGIKKWELITELPHERPDLKVINGKM